MSNFYNQNITLQWVIALLMFIVPFIFVVLWMKLFEEYTIIACFFIPFIPSLIQFFGAPIAKLSGHHKYLSPMFLVDSTSNNTYVMHNGTTFDYLVNMRNVKPGVEFNKKMLVFYLDGLLNIIDKIESNEISEDSLFQGSSYFFNDRTAKKLGFKLAKARFTLKVFFLINYFDLTWMYSLSKGLLTFPNINNIQTVSITGGNLVKNKTKLNNLRLFLIRNCKEAL